MKFLPFVSVFFFLCFAGCENKPAVEQKSVAEKSKATKDKSKIQIGKGFVSNGKSGRIVA